MPWEDRLRSPFARAVVPVAAGVAGIGALAGFLWLMAAFISGGNAETTERIAPSVFTVGPVETISDAIADDGPLLFPELGTSIGTRSVVVDHTGDVPADGWRVYWAYPADRPPSCLVEQVAGTSEFVDCDGRTLDVSELSPPDEGVYPRVEERTTLVIDLRGAGDGPESDGADGDR